MTNGPLQHRSTFENPVVTDIAESFARIERMSDNLQRLAAAQAWEEAMLLAETAVRGRVKATMWASEVRTLKNAAETISNLSNPYVTPGGAA